MNTLTLTLHKKWFDMILSGEKTEEYREIKPYWVRRLIGNWQYYTHDSVFLRGTCLMPYGVDKIRFKNGYAKDAPEFVIEWLGIEVGEPNTNWSPVDAHGKFVFILKLGKVLESNCQSKVNKTKKWIS